MLSVAVAAVAEVVHVQVVAGLEAARRVQPAAGEEAAGLVGGRPAKKGPTAARWATVARHAAVASLAP